MWNCVDDDLARCRRLGLVVDEDFERGISRASRRVRTAALAVIILVIALLSAATMSERAIAMVRPRLNRAADHSRHRAPSLDRSVRVAPKRVSV
jgi:hypothetical protein